MSWPLVAIKEVAKVVTGKTPSTVDEQNFGGNIPFVTPAELGLEAYVTSAPRTLSAKGASAIKLVPKNAVMVCCIGSLGKMAIAGTPVATNQQINSVIFDENRVDAKYGFYALQLLKPKMEAMAPSTTVAIVNKGNFEAMQIPLPPLPEQKRIAAILDKADAIRRKRQQAIQLADEFLRAVFLDMFGDPVTNPKGWEVSQVESRCEIVRGSSPRPQGDPRFYGGPVPRLMVADLTRDGRLVTPMIDSLTEEGAKKSRPIKAGTVVMAVSGNVGLTSVLAVDACIHDGFIAFKELESEMVRPEFLCELMMWLKSTHASRQAGAIFKNLTTTQIKEMEIPIPPVELQDKFISVSRKVEEIYSEDGGPLFESICQKAFSGRL